MPQRTQLIIPLSPSLFQPSPNSHQDLLFPVGDLLHPPHPAAMADDADMRNELSDMQQRADQLADEVRTM